MYRQDEPEVNFDQIMERLRNVFGRFRLGGGGGNGFSLVILGVFVIALGVWLGTGFYTVQPGEEAALRRLGIFDNLQGPGLHWFWPAPIGTRNIVTVDERRSLELGVRGQTPVIEEALMITGDQNIVNVELQVQYDISDLESFLFRVVDPAGETIKDAAETSLREVIGSRVIDDVLTTEKEAVQVEVKLQLQELLDLYQTGIRVIEVKLLNVRPPEQVQDAFDDVVRAREDKERTINLAEAYRESQLPRARGEAARQVEGAEAFKQERIANATGQSSRFLSILREFENSEEVTRQRLYLEAMEEILPGVTKFIVDSDNGGSLLQFLPLSPDSSTQFPPATPRSSQGTSPATTPGN
jgi:membrane protease subunit HflK